MVHIGLRPLTAHMLYCTRQPSAKRVKHSKTAKKVLNERVVHYSTPYDADGSEAEGRSLINPIIRIGTTFPSTVLSNINFQDGRSRDAGPGGLPDGACVVERFRMLE